MVVVATLTSLLLAGCVVVAPETSQSRPRQARSTQREEPTRSVDGSAAQAVVARLKKAGLRSSVVSTPTPEAQGSLFDPGEFLLKTRGGAFLRVFVFPDADMADRAAGSVRSNGLRQAGTGASPTGTPMSPDYPAPAHFFSADRSIIVYFEASEDVSRGESGRVIGALRKAYGREFALSR